MDSTKSHEQVKNLIGVYKKYEIPVPFEYIVKAYGSVPIEYIRQCCEHTGQIPEQTGQTSNWRNIAITCCKRHRRTHLMTVGEDTIRAYHASGEKFELDTLITFSEALECYYPDSEESGKEFELSRLCEELRSSRPHILRETLKKCSLKAQSLKASS